MGRIRWSVRVSHKKATWSGAPWVLNLLVRLGGRRARRGAWGIGPVMRWIGEILTAAPKLASSCSLDTSQSEFLGIVQVINYLVVRCAKGPVVGGCEGGQNDSPEHIVDGDFVHEGENFAGVADHLRKWSLTASWVSPSQVTSLPISRARSKPFACACDSEENHREVSPTPSGHTKPGQITVCVEKGVCVGELGPHTGKRR